MTLKLKGKKCLKCGIGQFISEMACTDDTLISIQKTTRKYRFLSDENVNEM